MIRSITLTIFLCSSLCMCFSGSKASEPIETYYLDRPGKRLCETPLGDVDCSNQVKSNTHHSSCLMRYLNRNSTECTESEFKGDIDVTDSYGSVDLIPYGWFDKFTLPFTAINVTFTKIKWQRLKMRFIKVRSGTPSLCREFIVEGDVDPSSVISFDCLWGQGAAEGNDFMFQFVLFTKDGPKLHTFLFEYPDKTHIYEVIAVKDYYLFVLLDQTAFPHIGLRVLVPPAEYNISRITVTLFYKSELSASAIPISNWTVHVSREQRFLTVGQYNTNETPGFYFYNASFEHSKCHASCQTSSTPHLEIRAWAHESHVTVALTVLTISSLGFLLYVIWKKRSKKMSKDVERPPNVLFVYESSYPSHVDNIYKLKEFLENNCYVLPKMDLIDIPKTDSMNPWKWYYRAFQEADYVLVFSSPDESTKKGIHEDNVYHNLHTYALKLLIVYLLNKHRFLVACVKLPGCSWDTLPPEALIINQKFSLPEKLSHFFKFLRLPPLPNGSSLLITALQQPRTSPRFIVSRPEAPLQLPFDAGVFDLSDDNREELTIKGVSINLDGTSMSEEEEDDDDYEGGLSLTGFKL